MRNRIDIPVTPTGSIERKNNFSKRKNIFFAVKEGSRKNAAAASITMARDCRIADDGRPGRNNRPATKIAAIPITHFL
jgi:hypothetical protein